MLTLKEAVAEVKEHYPFAVARSTGDGWEVLISHAARAERIVWGQRDMESAWFAAAQRLERR